MASQFALFTYGSLMIPRVMAAVTGGGFASRPARLQGYARYCLKGVSYPGLIPEADAETRGIVYLDVDPESLSRLDQFEGECYERVTVSVIPADSQPLRAHAYVIAPHHRHRVLRRPWDLRTFISRDLVRFLDHYPGFERAPAGTS